MNSSIAAITQNNTDTSALISIADTLIKYWPLVLGSIALIALLVFIFKVTKYCINLVAEINKVKVIETDIDEIKNDSNFIKGKVTAIEKLLKTFAFSSIGYSSAKALVKSRSPLSLTPSGEKVLEESGFSKIYEDNKERFLSLARAENPKLKYDAQQDAFSIMITLADDPIMEPVKKYTFSHGYNLSDVLKSWWYFPKRPNYKRVRFKGINCEEKKYQ